MGVSAQSSASLGGPGSARYFLALWGGAVVCAFAATQVDQKGISLVLLSVALGLCTVGAIIGGVYVYGLRRQRLRRSVISTYLANDTSYCFVTDTIGRVTFANKAAQEGVSLEDGQTLAFALRDLMGNPGTLLARMQIRAFETGGADEQVATRRGHLRLKVSIGIEV